MNDLKITVTHIKVLKTIMDLNKQGFFPLNEGIYKILSGTCDDETSNFVNLETFGTLISYSSKKICNYTLLLFRHKYIEKVFHEKSNELYFKVTKLGEDLLVDYFKKHSLKFEKKSKIVKTTIVKM